MSNHTFSPERQKEILWSYLLEQLASVPESAPELKLPLSSSHLALSNSKSTCHFSKQEWPTYKTIMDDITNSDYNHVLECPHDIVHETNRNRKSNKPSKLVRMVVSQGKSNLKTHKHKKAFCPHGTACCARMELFHNISDCNESYTGLLTPGKTVEHCIIRLSSAIKPPAGDQSKFGKFFLHATGGKLRHAKLFPMVALKCFRTNKRSGNLLFAGRKIGQASSDFFSHVLCTQITERVPGLLKPFVQKFYSYSENPLSLGVSDFCKWDEHGEDNDASDHNFPYVVMLSPVYQKFGTAGQDDDEDNYETFDEFIEDLLEIPSGSVLFDIFACPTPSCALDSSRIQRIGRIVSASEMIASTPDDGLFFRHQKKEEDYELRPEWRTQAKASCSPDGGKTTGTIDRLVGSTILEGLIKEEKYIDFEDNR